MTDPTANPPLDKARAEYVKARVELYDHAASAVAATTPPDDPDWSEMADRVEGAIRDGSSPYTAAGNAFFVVKDRGAELVQAACGDQSPFQALLDHPQSVCARTFADVSRKTHGVDPLTGQRQGAYPGSDLQATHLAEHALGCALEGDLTLANQVRVVAGLLTGHEPKLKEPYKTGDNEDRAACLAGYEPNAVPDDVQPMPPASHMVNTLGL